MPQKVTSCPHCSLSLLPGCHVLSDFLHHFPSRCSALPQTHSDGVSQPANHGLKLQNLEPNINLSFSCYCQVILLQCLKADGHLRLNLESGVFLAQSSCPHSKHHIHLAVFISLCMSHNHHKFTVSKIKMSTCLEKTWWHSFMNVSHFVPSQSCHRKPMFYHYFPVCGCHLLLLYFLLPLALLYSLPSLDSQISLWHDCNIA